MLVVILSLLILSVLSTLTFIYYRKNYSREHFSSSGSEFNNFCLTPKPRGRPNPSCSVWRNIPFVRFPYRQRVPYPKPYQSTVTRDKQPVNFPLEQTYCPDYYLDPSLFCQKNPTHRLCPNHWLYR